MPKVIKELTEGNFQQGVRAVKPSSMYKFMVKCLKLNQTDTVPFLPKQVKQPQLKQVAFNTSVLDEPTRIRYYDRDRMAEIQIERWNDILYAVIRKVDKLPPVEEPPKQKV